MLSVPHDAARTSLLALRAANTAPLVAVLPQFPARRCYHAREEIAGEEGHHPENGLTHVQPQGQLASGAAFGV